MRDIREHNNKVQSMVITMQYASCTVSCDIYMTKYNGTAKKTQRINK